jgi:hypothetical protein
MDCPEIVFKKDQGPPPEPPVPPPPRLICSSCGPIADGKHSWICNLMTGKLFKKQ